MFDLATDIEFTKQQYEIVVAVPRDAKEMLIDIARSDLSAISSSLKLAHVVIFASTDNQRSYTYLCGFKFSGGDVMDAQSAQISPKSDAIVAVPPKATHMKIAIDSYAAFKSMVEVSWQ